MTRDEALDRITRELGPRVVAGVVRSRARVWYVTLSLASVIDEHGNTPTICECGRFLDDGLLGRTLERARRDWRAWSSELVETVRLV